MNSCEIDGHKALGFDTGLTARAFAQAKIAQFITEPGLIVRPTEAPPHRIELWKASGVREETGADGAPTMVIWGPPVAGERLDALLNESQPPDTILAAVSLWIKAILALEEDTPPGGAPPAEIPLWPSAAIVAQGDEGRPPSVFFAPSALAQRGVTPHDEWYVNPALNGKEARAFTAAALLYRVFAGAPPFSAANTSVLYEDMRDGNFLPIHLAVPGLDPRLAAFIQSALVPNSITQRREDAEEFTNLLENSAASLVRPLSETDRLLLEKEKAQFLKIKAASVKTKRFVARNTALLIGALAGAVAAIFIFHSVISARAALPTTEGMDPVQVIESYYHGFGKLDHQMMEACVTGGAGKNDINAVVTFFVMSKTRQAYERNASPLVFPAHQWQGGDLPDAPLFGASNLRVELLDGDYGSGELRYRVDYAFWIPEQLEAEEALNPDSPPPSGSHSYPRRDLLTLVLKRGNWRIAEIIRD